MDQELIRARIRHAERRRRRAQGNRRKRPLPPMLLGSVRASRKKRSRMPQFVIAGVVLLTLTFLIAAVSFIVGSVTAVSATVHQYREVNAQLPNAADVASNAFQTTTIYDRNGVLLQQVDQKDGGWRNFVPLEDVSPYLIQATISAEDATFWTHYGVEPIAIVRGATIILGGAGSSGGSTITQQLARGLYPDQIGTDYSLTRKAHEAMAAVALEKEFSKEDILTMYLNLIFYGQRSYGIEAASNTYFQKHAERARSGRGLDAGRPSAGAVPVRSDLELRAGQEAAEVRARPDGQVRLHHPGSSRQGLRGEARPANAGRLDPARRRAFHLLRAELHRGSLAGRALQRRPQVHDHTRRRPAGRARRTS